MKILAVLPTYRSDQYHGKIGGGEISNRLLLEGLASRGHSVTVCTLNPGPDTRTYRNGVEVLSPCLSSNESIYGRFRRIRGYKKFIERSILLDMPDIVLTGTFGIGPSLSVVNKYGLSIAVFVRAFENFESFKNSDSRFKFFLKKMIYGDIGPSSLKKADYLLPNSRFMADVCRDLVPGVEQRVVYPALLYSDLEDIKIPRNPKNIFMVGSSEHKGFPVFQHLAENFPELDFHVLGDTDSSEGGNGKKENLIFHGWTDVVSILTKSADLLLVPSLCPEAFGRVAVEGLISGTPILVSNIGGLPEAVSFEKDLMVESGNKEAWRKAVSDFVNDPEKVCSATGRAQRNCGAFSLERQLFELEDFIVNVLG